MKRNSKGNMIVLSGAFLVVNAVALVVASSFGSLFFVHNRMQAAADELAIVGAQKLNELDRIGQMNNMIARSRQFVFDAQSSDQTVQSTMNHIADISAQLYTDAHEGAQLLETERLKLRSVSMNEASTAITSRYQQIKNGYELSLPWLEASNPAPLSITFGCANNIKSNVAQLSGLDALSAADKASGYVSTDNSKLYNDNINAKLPGAASDLSFKISSLPAPVQTNIAPARATLANAFKPASSDQLYSSVQVSFQLNVSTKLAAETQAEMKSIGTAVATGGQPMM
jgi:hypothetical protein